MPDTMDATPARIGNRHRVERLLARGGMGAVYEVIDECDGKRLALKLMHDSNVRLQTLFEREYRTLCEVHHPRIVEAYEYGFDGARPFYTMELVEGRDLHGLSPLAYPTACGYLRDVASALSLLHTRGMLHRDLTARNVRATDDGHCKLLDFGAVAPFGTHNHIVGTPPCVAPEALRGAPLDQRTDLFALGTLAYWLLTGTHAFAARTLQELPNLWALRPERPSKLAPQANVPRELDTLVLQLLSLDPAARPHHTTDVIERLSVIAQLPPESAETQIAIARSYFETPQFVGRTEQQRQLIEALDRARAGQGGGCWIIDGDPGSGRSRLLSELVIQARLRGFTTLSVDAGANPQLRGTAVALVNTALDTAAGAKRAAEPYAGLLAQADRDVAARLSLAPAAPEVDISGSWRARVQQAMHSVLMGAAEGAPLLIAVDDLDAADEASLSLLQTLSFEVARSALVLVGVCQRELGTTSPLAASPTAALRQRSQALQASPLDHAEMRALLRSLFGDAPALARFSSWLHEASNGLPLFALELVKQLFARNVVRYLDGIWVLPTERPAEVTAQDLRALLCQRVEQLSPETRRFAALLAVQRGPLTRASCLALGESTGVDAMQQVAALTRCAILRDQDIGYRFTQRALATILLTGLAPQELRELHLRSARTLLAASDAGAQQLATRIAAGFHLLQAGEETEGADLLAEVTYDHAGVRVAFADVGFVSPAIEAALEVYTRQGRSIYERMPLLAALAQAGYYDNYVLARRYGQQALDAVESVLHIPLARRLRRYLGANLALTGALLAAYLRFRTQHAAHARYRFRDALLQFFSVVTTLTGVAGIQLDSERAAQITRSLEPFAKLPRRLTPVGVWEFCALMVGIGVERELREIPAAWELFERFGHPKWYVSLQARERKLYRAGVLYAVGAIECFRDSGGALRAAAELDRLDLALYAMIAAQLRALHHAFRGERRLFQHYREQVEQHAVKAGSAWQVELWEPAGLLLVQLATFDLVEAKRLADRLDSYAPTVPSLARHARLAHLIMRTARLEELPVVVSELEALLTEVAPRGFVGWAAAHSLLARCQNRMGHHAQAKHGTEQALALVSDQDRELVALFLGLEIEHALARSGLGDHAAAAAQLDALLQRHTQGQNPLTLGRLHEARALVALATDDRTAFSAHAQMAQRWFGATEIEVLVARGQALTTHASRVSLQPLASGSGRPAPATITVVSSVGCDAQRLVEQLQRATRTADCALFRLEAHQPQLLAFSGEQPANSLLDALRRRIEQTATWVAEQDGETTTSTAAAEACQASPDAADGLSIFVLTTTEDAAARIVGAVVLDLRVPHSIPPTASLLRNLAQQLLPTDPQQASSGE